MINQQIEQDNTLEETSSRDNVSTVTFSQWGHHFEKKVMQGLLVDPAWAEQMSEVLEPRYFDLKYLHYLSERYLNYAKKYNAYPTLQLLVAIVKDELKQGSDIALKEQVVEYLKNLRNSPDMGDLPLVKEKALEFCRRQALKRALEKTVELVATEKYETIVDIIKKAVSVGTTASLGHDLFDDVEARYVTLKRSCIPTGMSELDDQKVLNGGSGRGELNVVIASTGVGKCVTKETKIKIKYLSYLIDNKLYKPWDSVIVDNTRLNAKDYANLNNNVSYKEIIEEIKICSLFELMNVYSAKKDKHGEILKYNEFLIDVESLDGFYPLEAFRLTKPEKVVSIKLSDGKLLTASPQHLVVKEEDKAIGIWKKIEEISIGDKISVSDNQLSEVVEISKISDTLQTLYDIQVGIAHSYMANGILSHNSHFLTMLGANAIRQGRNVLYYTFELSEAKVGIRFDSNFTDIDSNDIFDQKDKVNEFYATNQIGKVKIKYFPTSQPTVNTLRAHMEKLALRGFIPDMVIIDYADIMRSTRQYDSPRHELKLLYEELRAFATERNVVLWTASQSNREGSSADIVDMDNMSESYAKAFVADLIITLSRKSAERADGSGRLYVAKNRNGRDGLVFPIKIDTARSKFAIVGEQTTPEHAKDDVQSDMRKALKNKFEKYENLGLKQVG